MILLSKLGGVYAFSSADLWIGPCYKYRLIGIVGHGTGRQIGARRVGSVGKHGGCNGSGSYIHPERRSAVGSDSFQSGDRSSATSKQEFDCQSTAPGWAD